MKIRQLLPSIIWSLIILWIICMPGNSIPKTPFINIPHFDKVVHAVIFAVLAFLVNYGLYRQNNTFIRKNHYTISIISGVIYGIITEWIQLKFIPGRSGEILDWVADVAGTIAGIIAFYLYLQFFPRSR
jgi:VanZ family protein